MRQFVKVGPFSGWEYTFPVGDSRLYWWASDPNEYVAVHTSNKFRKFADLKVNIKHQFSRLVDLVKHATKEEAANVQQAALDWGKEFLDLGRKGFRGFQPPNLTPYCHLVITHAAEQVARDGPLNRFSGERLERCNDEIKQLHLRQTNCKEMDPTIRLQKRYEMARRKKEIKVMQRNASKVLKMSCQVFWHST